MNDSLQEKSTVKTMAAVSMDEKEYAQWLYDQALEKMTKNPTKANIDAFTEANKHLYEVQDAYRIGTRLLLERMKNLRKAVNQVLGQ